MSNSKLVETENSLDQITTKICEVTKQVKIVESLFKQLMENNTILKTNAVKYDYDVHEIYKIYNDIYELLIIVDNESASSSVPKHIRARLNQMKLLFDEARIKQYETQLILPMFPLSLNQQQEDLKESNNDRSQSK